MADFDYGYDEELNPIKQLRVSYQVADKAGNEKPIVELVNTILSLQIYEELDDVCELAKRKLEAMFEDVPYKKGYKYLNNYLYFPNGLCRSTSKTVMIALAPYEVGDELSTKRTVNKRPGYHILERFSPAWQKQMYLHQGRKVNYQDTKLSIQEAMEKYKQYQSLTEEEQKMLPNYKKLVSGINDSLSFLKPWIGTRCRDDNSRMSLLVEDQIKAIENIYDTYNVMTDSKRFDLPHNIFNSIFKFVENISKDCIKTDIGVLDIHEVVLIPENRWRHECLDYNLDMGVFIEKGYPKFVALGEQYPHLKKLFIKCGILPKK